MTSGCLLLSELTVYEQLVVAIVRQVRGKHIWLGNEGNIKYPLELAATAIWKR
jgi:hypothetical protein